MPLQMPCALLSYMVQQLTSRRDRQDLRVVATRLNALFHLFMAFAYSTAGTKFFHHYQQESAVVATAHACGAMHMGRSATLLWGVVLLCKNHTAHTRMVKWIPRRLSCTKLICKATSKTGELICVSLWCATTATDHSVSDMLVSIMSSDQCTHHRSYR